jgi:acetoacetate decarboxylase
MKHISIILAINALTFCLSLQAICQKNHSTYKLESGDTVELPLRYKDWSWMMATFSIPLDQAKQLLPDSLIPITYSEGTALISFGAYHYPRVEGLAPYDEFLVSIPVQYNKVSKPNDAKKFNPLFPQEVYNKGGSYIYYLPVTTEESFRVGSEIWGFPKVVRKMIFEEKEQKITCKLFSGSDLEMTIEMDKIKTSDSKENFTYCAYTKKGDQLLRTCCSANGNYGIKYKGIVGSITFGIGEVSQTLKRMDISKKPLQLFYATGVTSELPAAGDYFPLKK